MNHSSQRSRGAFLLFAICTAVAALAQTPAPPSSPDKSPQKKQVHSTTSNPEERAFQANCSRCHYAPETLSPRITGTVVRHMRVRANLSAEDERLILSYLNP
jgi:cytochrome c5